VARIVVDVMPKAEILERQWIGSVRALDRLGIAGVADVRQGKRFELEVDGDLSDEQLEQIAADVLTNTVIEDFTITRVNA